MITIQSCKTAIAMAAVFAASGSFAATMSKTEYSSTKDHVSADFKADKAACASFSGNQKDVCMEQAKGKE